MGKHLSAAELDAIQTWKSKGVTAAEIHRKLQGGRRRKRMAGPDLSTVHRALKGASFQRTRVESRGRKRALSSVNVRALDRTRRRLITKADGDYEVHWDDVIRAARTPAVHRTTAARALKAAGYKVQRRNPRLKPDRSKLDEAQRKEMCDKLRKLPLTYWTQTVDAYIDCKRWRIPRNIRGRKFLNKLKVRFHLRTPEEGLQRGFTKPDARKHHRNTGPNMNLCAGIVGGRIRVWHYLPGRWSGAAAADLYRDVIAPALKRHCGVKRKYILLEDNDPTGFKSTRGIEAKAALNIEPLRFPTYSPELNPLDFAVWDEVERRMSEQKAPANESVHAFKARLRRTALAIPAPVVTKMLCAIKRRAQSVYDHDGGNIPED